MSTIFDSHCHPQFPQYDKDRDEVIKRALKQGVFMICVGTGLEMSKKAIELASRHEGMWATIGLHPNDAVLSSKYYVLRDYEELLKEDKVVAVGEIGLDYYRTPEPKKRENQKKVFEQFVDLAVKHKKPLIIHCRDSKIGSAGPAYRDLIEILNTKYLIHDTDLQGVVHSFTGTLEEAKKYLNLGFYLGFNGIITFTDQYNEVIEKTPLDKILLETDAPYLAPVPYRGQRNEPAYVIEVAKKLAELKNLSIDEVIEKTTKNCENLFKINA